MELMIEMLQALTEETIRQLPLKMAKRLINLGHCLA